ncbi:MAG: YigZ family protein, partial [Ignavibacteria bacterium]|nr:YigZ family protein [Ignavibacteria bacterium]
AIKSKNLTNILVVVIRYFGGTKLGVGPLAKAYYESAEGVLKLVEIKKKYITHNYKLILTYDEYEKLKSSLKHFIKEVISTDYADKISFLASVKLSRAKEFEDFLKNFFKGKIVYERIE